MRPLMFALPALWLLAACGGDKTVDKKSAAEGTVAAGGDVKARDQAPKIEVKAEVVEVDTRAAPIQEELEKYLDVAIAHDASELAEGEKKMLSHLVKASKIIEELYMLQIHPSNVEWRDKVEKAGTWNEKLLFYRNQAPWCLDNKEPDCCALAEKPEKQTGLALWPEGMTDEEFKVIGRQINRKELMSPFTVVARKESDGFDAIPYAATEIFGERMKKTAEELRGAAESAPDKSLKKFLLSRADAFESKSAFPYDASDFDWIALKGDWEVLVGPYEVYESPRQIKALFEMFVGREDKEVTEELSEFKKNLQEMESAISELVGQEIYQGRRLASGISIRAVDVWTVTGEGRRPRGATVALHLPNRGKAVSRGLYKKLIIVNHSKAFEPILKARAESVLDEIQLRYVDANAGVINVLFHELSHGFGAHGEMKVTNPNGKVVTVKESLGKYDSLFEELKADVVGLWLLKFQTEKGGTTEKQRRQRYTTSIMHSLGLLQYPLEETHSQMAAVQIGWYLDAKAMTWDGGSKQIRIDFDKIPEAVESLAREVASIQLTGDPDRAKDLVEKHLIPVAGGKYEAKGVLASLRNQTIEKFKNSGIKVPSLRYEIKGLEESE